MPKQQTDLYDMEVNENGQDRPVTASASSQPESSRPGGPNSGGGCHVSTLAGFFLLLLVLVLVAGVALVVFFASSSSSSSSSSRDITCKLEPGTSSAGQPSGGGGGVNEVVTYCKAWVQNGGNASHSICEVCPTASDATSSATTRGTNNSTTTTTTATTTTNPSDSTTASSVDRNSYRLPGDVRPQHYEVLVQPHMRDNDSSAFYFNGSGVIHVECLNATDTITVHMDGLNISDRDIHVQHQDRPKENLFRSSSYDQARSFLHLQLSTPMGVGEVYVIGLQHLTGQLSTTHPTGLYLRHYRDGGDTVYLVTSQTEPVYFRKIFPSFDEPRMKATFDVTIVRRNDTKRQYISLSTGQLIHTDYTQDARGQMWAWDSFETTPVMSTYMLTLTVCALPYLTGTVMSDRNVTFRTFAPPRAMPWAKEIQQHGMKLLQWMDSRFKPSYAHNFPTFDNAEVLKLGNTMEAMLSQPDAHQTLGMISRTAAKMAHTIKIWLSVELPLVMDTDALLTSRALSHDVIKSPDDVMSIYNDVTFTKLYLTNNLYNNTESSDLLAALDQKMQERNFSAGYMTAKMDSWISHPGFPVVMVTRTPRGYQLTQKRFLIGSGQDDNSSYQWEIPVTYATSQSPRMSKSRDDIVWLSKNEELTIADSMVKGNNSWILINVDQVTYCRVLYDAATWRALIGQLKRDPKVIPPANRAQIINDAMEFARAGLLEVSVALSTLDFVRSDDDLVPLTAFQRHMEHLEMMLRPTDLFPLLQACWVGDGVGVGLG
ncbi:hypothetical protein ACOMHN_017233 [Nucella lapillus]